MQRPFLIIKLGSTFADYAVEHGDFADWIGEPLQKAGFLTFVINPIAGEDLPDPDSILAVIVTGSHEMVTDKAAWSESTAAWLRSAVETGVPVLGICYGHQLLALAFGGTVGDNPKGREFGTQTIRLLGAAQQDRLFDGLAKEMPAHTCHTQSVLRLPDHAVRLAASEMDANQAFFLPPHAWGVQFHPEFDADSVLYYVEQFRETLTAEGQDVEQLLATIQETPAGAALIVKFAALAADIHG